MASTVATLFMRRPTTHSQELPICFTEVTPPRSNWYSNSNRDKEPPLLSDMVRRRDITWLPQLAMVVLAVPVAIVRQISCGCSILLFVDCRLQPSAGFPRQKLAGKVTNDRPMTGAHCDSYSGEDLL